MQTTSSITSRQGSLRRSVHFPSSMQDDGTAYPESLSTARRGSDSSITSSLLEDGTLGRSNSLSKRDRAKKLGSQLKILSKRAIGRSTESLDTAEAERNTATNENQAEGMADSSIMEHAQDFQRDHKTMGEVIQDKLGLVKHVAKVIAHPRHHPKRQAASIIPISEHPYLSDNADEELIEAEAELQEATVAPFSKDQSAWDNLDEKREQLEEIQHERQARKDAWMLGKHVERVRTVPLRLVDYPALGDFHEYAADGDRIRWQWERYFGHLMLYATQGFVAPYVDESDDQTFRRDTSLRILERMLVASTYWQNWFMHLRKVYRWEDKINSTKWLVGYFVLLKTGYIMTPAFLWIIYITVKNKLAMDDVRFVKESHERAQSGMTPQKLSELFQRHGGENWVDPLLDEIGPLIQQQLGDLADFLEIIWNFYTWQKPRRTIHTLVFFFTCAIVAVLTPSEYGAKIIAWVFGIFFFFSRPVASYYPKYRKVVSLPRWLLWNIPTNAELAMDHLREQAQTARDKLILNIVEKQIAQENVPIRRQKRHLRTVPLTNVVTTEIKALPTEDALPLDPSPSSSDTDDDQTIGLLHNADMMSFRGKYNGDSGSLVISTSGIRFIKDNPSLRHALKHAGNTTKTRSRGTEVLWSQSYSTLHEMRKTLVATESNPLSRRAKAFKTNALILDFIDGSAYKIGNMARRDEAFNAIIGVSGLRFKELEPLAGEVDGDEGGGFVKGKGDADDRGDKHQGSVLKELGKLY